MKKKVYCEKCGLEIKKGEKVAGMHTYNKFPDVSDERYFHFDCFLKWRNESIENRAKKIYAQTMEKIAPQARTMVNNILGINDEEETDKSNLQEIWVG
jgi:transposase-like protein